MSRNLLVPSMDAVNINVPKGIIKSSGKPAKILALGLGAIALFKAADNAKSEKMQNIYAFSGLLLTGAAIYVAVAK